MMQERLSYVVGCPQDIFSSIPSTEENMRLIVEANNGSAAAASALADMLIADAERHGRCTSSLSYFVSKACSTVEKCSVELCLRYLSVFVKYRGGAAAARDCLSFIERARSSGQSLGDEDELRELLRRAGVRIAVAVADEKLHEARAKKVGVSDIDCDDILASIPELLELGEADAASVRLFVYAADAARYSEQIRSLVATVGIGSVARMILNERGDGCDSAGRECASADDEISRLRELMYSQPVDGWRDFWLRTMYSFVTEYLHREPAAVARDAVVIIEGRESVGECARQALAFARYYLSCCVGTENEEWASQSCERLCCRCIYSGVETEMSDEQMRELMHRGIYADTSDRAALDDERRRLGNEIVHDRNRLCLTATLDGHGKRGRMHAWSTRLSVRCDLVGGAMPHISSLEVGRVNNSICRGESTIECDRAHCQLILYGEIQTVEMRHPFEADVVIDISYVSAAKCAECEIEVRESYIDGDYFVMDCRLYLH